MGKSARTYFIAILVLLLLPTILSVAQSGVRAVVVNEAANIRIAPALGAEVIATVSAGYVFEIVTGRSPDNQWLRVDFNGDEGWVHVAPLTILSGDINTLEVGDPRSIPYGGPNSPRAGTSNATSANQVRVTNGLRVRSGPGQGYPTLANMFAGTVVPVFGRTASNRWIQVNYQGTLGWASTSFVEFMNGLSLVDLPIGGIVADAPPIVGRATEDYFDTLRLMLARLDLAQPSLDNIRAKWTDAALQGRAFCRDYPARPSDIGIGQPTLAAYFNILDPLQRDFNDAMFNLRKAIDLFIEVCNQPGLGNPVGQGTVIGALDVVNLADRQFAYLRSRLIELIPEDRELGPDECLFQYRTKQEILKIVATSQIVRQRFQGPLDRTFGYCIELHVGIQYAFQTLLLKGNNPDLLVVLTPFDNPTNFVVTTGTDPNFPSTFIAPLVVPETKRYLLILSARQDPALVNAEVAFLFSVIPPSGIVGQLLYDELNDVVFQAIPGVGPTVTATPGTASSNQSVNPGAPQASCPSLAFTCDQFFTCQEARACLALGNTSLDPDGNGVPCENICSP